MLLQEHEGASSEAPRGLGVRTAMAYHACIHMQVLMPSGMTWELRLSRAEYVNGQCV